MEKERQRRAAEQERLRLEYGAFLALFLLKFFIYTVFSVVFRQQRLEEERLREEAAYKQQEALLQQQQQLFKDAETKR